MFKWLSLFDRKPKLECKSPEWFTLAMRSGVMFYHVFDNTKCVITHIHQWHGQTGCDITLKSIDDRRVSEYRVSSLEMHLYFKEIVGYQVSV